MLSLLLAAFLACQDPIEASLKLLSDKDPAVRDAATVELMKTPLDKLALVEKRLKDPDSDVAMRARKVMNYVLKENFGLRKARFELRPLAPLKVMEEWVKAGADTKKPPPGFEAVRYADGARKAEGYDQEWILGGPTCISSVDVSDAKAEPDVQARSGQWQVRFELTPAGAEKFDQVAAELYERKPNGALAILLDGRIISAPIVRSPRLGGRGTIQGNYSEKEAKEVAGILTGDKQESYFLVGREKDSAEEPDKTMEAIRAIKGLGIVSFKPDGAATRVSGFTSTEEIDLIRLWQVLRDRGYRLETRK